MPPAITLVSRKPIAGVRFVNLAGLTVGTTTMNFLFAEHELDPRRQELRRGGEAEASRSTGIKSRRGRPHRAFHPNAEQNAVYSF